MIQPERDMFVGTAIDCAAVAVNTKGTPFSTPAFAACGIDISQGSSVAMTEPSPDAGIAGLVLGNYKPPTLG